MLRDGGTEEINKFYGQANLTSTTKICFNGINVGGDKIFYASANDALMGKKKFPK